MICSGIMFTPSLCYFLTLPFLSCCNIELDQLLKKYKNARTNLRDLEILGASLLHGVDATRMKLLPDLQCRKFHRIIYNFPHAGFHSKEGDPALIKYVSLAVKSYSLKHYFLG